MQNPNDAWIVQEIISETEPDFVIGTGTLMSGSALMWATILREVNSDGHVIKIVLARMEAINGFPAITSDFQPDRERERLISYHESDGLMKRVG